MKAKKPNSVLFFLSTISPSDLLTFEQLGSEVVLHV